VLAYLAWDDTCTINGTVTVDGEEVTEPGEYEGVIVVTPAEASGEAATSSEADMVAATAEYEITVNGVTAVASYQDTDDGTSEVKGFVITFDGQEIEGVINMGVWTASSGDEDDQAVCEAFQEVYEANNLIGPGK
ncbi:MAG: hypothetical protein LUH42_04870, partial [Oscillospiraceae bacterium]|nr:hypothetical protein [Oscillospiraceae bacterium]